MYWKRRINIILKCNTISLKKMRGNFLLIKVHYWPYYNIRRGGALYYVGFMLHCIGDE